MPGLGLHDRGEREHRDETGADRDAERAEAVRPQAREPARLPCRDLVAREQQHGQRHERRPQR